MPYVTVTCERCGKKQSSYRYIDLEAMGWEKVFRDGWFRWYCPDCKGE